jgi:N-acetylneuraminic acid mutarotase
MIQSVPELPTDPKRPSRWVTSTLTSLLTLLLIIVLAPTAASNASVNPFFCAAPESAPNTPPTSLQQALFAPLNQNGSTALFGWSNRTNSPIPRSEALGVGINKKIYVFGGYNAALQATTRSDVYDTVTDSWQMLSPMPEALTHTPVVRDGQNIWFIGGFLGDHPGPSIERVWKYDVSNDTWSAGPSLPQPQGAGAAAIIDRTIYFYGGTNRQNGIYNDVASHYALDLDNLEAGWQTRAPLPVARNHLGGMALNGKIYAIGGQSVSYEKDTNTVRVDVYDPASDTWSQAADMPRGLGHTTASIIAVNGQMIVIGGTINGGNNGLESAYVLLYDPEENIWLHLPSLPGGRKTPVADMVDSTIYVATGAGGSMSQVWAGTLLEHWEIAANLPVALGGTAGGIIGNQLYLVGDGSPTTLAYNLSDNTWSNTVALPERPYQGSYHAAEIIGRKLYLFGGLGSSAGKVQIYDPTANSWSSGSDMPFATGASTSALIGDYAYVVGGTNGITSTNQAARYDPLTNSWSNIAPMPYPRSFAAATTNGQKLYVFGGRGPTSSDPSAAEDMDTVQIYDPATDSWSTSLDSGTAIPAMPHGRSKISKAVFVMGEIYIIGGATQSDADPLAEQAYSQVDIYNPTTQSWRAGVPMPTARYGSFPLLIANRIYVAAGNLQSDTTQSAQLEVYNPAQDPSLSQPSPTSTPNATPSATAPTATPPIAATTSPNDITPTTTTSLTPTIPAQDTTYLPLIDN